MPQIVNIFFVMYLLAVFPQFLKADDTPWPIPDWQNSKDKSLLESTQCLNFKNFSTENPEFKTDSLLVIKNGLINYEFYDSETNANKPHVLWSITKTITGLLLGIAQRDGRINLDQLLHEYLPNATKDMNYNKITINNLLYLDPGFIWEESMKDVLLNPVVNMLYGKGHKNMTDFATAKKIIKEGPGYKWSYSTGTPVITMGILKKIYDPNSYNDMPWRNLFNPLGIKTMTFERDSAGTYIGGAGAFATSRDLAKIGYLYLNHGVWNGNMIVSEEWINKMLTPSPGYISPGTKIKNITDDGVYGGSIWLNKRIKKEFGKPYPYSPEDMYMAVGFMGQLLIILPSQQMIIVRTGYDTAVNSKIDEFVSRAISCFHDPKYPVGREIPAPETAKLDMVKLIRNVKNSIDANTLQATIAKTVCSCHLVSNNEIPVCLKRNNFNFSKYLTKVEVKKNINYEGMISIQVKLSRFARLFKLHYGNSAIAYFNPKQPEYGCTLK